MAEYKVNGMINVDSNKATDEDLLDIGHAFRRAEKLPEKHALIVSRNGQPVYVLTSEGEWM